MIQLLKDFSSFIFYFLMDVILLEMLVLAVLICAYVIYIGFNELLGIDLVMMLRRKNGKH